MRILLIAFGALLMAGCSSPDPSVDSTQEATPVSAAPLSPVEQPDARCPVGDSGSASDVRTLMQAHCSAKVDPSREVDGGLGIVIACTPFRVDGQTFEETFFAVYPEGIYQPDGCNWKVYQ